MRVFAILLVFLLFGCKKEVQLSIKTTDTIVKVQNIIDFHNSKNSLDWDGTYKGIIPCADCEGIETEVLLNKDLT